MRVLWLADVLRAEGLEVKEVVGWRERGRPMAVVNGVVIHHTATGPNVTDERVAMLLRDGRPDLKGPLSQLGLDRQGRFWVIASGRCNHNGFGEWGNDSIGIEGFNDGRGEAWPDAQMRAFERGTTAILRELGLPPAHAKGHKETDPGRKVDPLFDMAAFRRALSPSPAPIPQEDDMAVLVKQKGKPEVWHVADARTLVHVIDGTVAEVLTGDPNWRAKVRELPATHKLFTDPRVKRIGPN